MNDFNLRKLVREVLDTSTMADPHDIADEVLRRIDDEDLRPALRQCLTDVVREQIRQSRNAFQPPAPNPVPPPPPVSPVRAVPPVPQVMQELPGGAPAMKPKPARSAKVAAIREHHQRWLRERLYASSDPRKWKFLGDCGFDDLMFAAGQRREDARRTSAVAQELERLAELVRQYGVARVRDLPEHILRAFKGGEAA